MIYEQILKETKKYVIAFFKSNANSNLVYHNKKHTERVVQAATKIGTHYHLTESDLFIVLAAAWFNDLGYYIDYASHKERAAEEAIVFFRKKGFDENAINAIVQCILSTYSLYPQTLQEKIVCDAEMFYLGSNDFRRQSKLQRIEYKAANNMEVSKDEWRGITIKMMDDHQYHTGYCRLLLNEKKFEVLKKLKRKDVKGSAFYAAAPSFAMMA